MNEPASGQKPVVPETHRSIFFWNLLGFGTGITTALALAVFGLVAGAAGVAGDAQTAELGQKMFETFAVLAGVYAGIVVISMIIAQIRLSRLWAVWPAYVLAAAFVLVILFSLVAPFLQ